MNLNSKLMKSAMITAFFALGESSFAENLYTSTCTVQADTQTARAEVSSTRFNFLLLAGKTSWQFYNTAGQLLTSNLQVISARRVNAGQTTVIDHVGVIPAEASSCAIDIRNVLAASGVTHGIEYVTQCFHQGNVYRTVMIPKGTGLSANGQGILSTYFLGSRGEVIAAWNFRPRDGVRLDPSFWTQVDGNPVSAQAVNSCIALPQNAAIVNTLSVNFDCRIENNHQIFLSVQNNSQISFRMNGSFRISLRGSNGQTLGSIYGRVGTTISSTTGLQKIQVGYDSRETAKSCEIDDRELRGLIQ